MIALGGLLWNRDDGVIAPMVALTLCATLAMAGLGTDFAIWYAQSRQLQTATDAAALAASTDADNPAAALNDAKAMFQANGLDPSKVTINLTRGYYCPSAGAAPAQRFNTSGCASLSAAAPDAISLTAQIASRSYLLRTLGTPGSRAPLQIGAKAIATQLNEAGLAAGTGLVALNPAIANAALQALLGTSINLTAVQYDGLANANIDALSFLNALATRLHVTAGTYSQLLQTQASVGDVLGATADVLAQQNQTAQVTAALSGLQMLNAALPGNPQVTLGQLFDLGVWGSTPVGPNGSPAALHAGLNVYQLANFSLQLANGSHAVTVPSSTLGIPNLASLTLAATAIEPPQQAYFAFGPVGMSVHTAQVRMQLNLQVLNLGGVLGPGVQVPIYVEVGSGDAALTDISCHGNPAMDSTVQALAQSAAISLSLGQAPAGLMTNFQNPVPASSIVPVPIIGLNLAGVLGLVTTTVKAQVAIQSNPQTLTFYQPGSLPSGAGSTSGVIGAPPWASDDGEAGVPARVQSGLSLSSALGSLASSLSLQVCVLQLGSLCIGQSTLTGAQLGPLFTILSPVLSSLDGVIAQLQTALGAQIGYMDVQVTGVRCGRPVLIS